MNFWRAKLFNLKCSMLWGVLPPWPPSSQKSWVILIRIPDHSEVANALGVAIARTTAEITILADTEKRELIISEEGHVQSIPRNFSLEDAIEIGEKALREKAVRMGARQEDIIMEVTESQEFNMIRDFYTTGKNIRVKVQIKPGLISTGSSEVTIMPKKEKKTGLIFFPAFDWAISANHPEREERLLYTQDQVFEEGLLDFPNIMEYKPGIATYADINRCHICVPNRAKPDNAFPSHFSRRRNHRRSKSSDRRGRQCLCPGASARPSFHAGRPRRTRLLQYQH